MRLAPWCSLCLSQLCSRYRVSSRRSVSGLTLECENTHATARVGSRWSVRTLTPQHELFFNLPVSSSFCILHSFLHNFFIRTPNRSILVSTESPQNLKSSYTNEGVIEGHHARKKIMCFLRLHDDFTVFFFDFVHFRLKVGLIKNLRKESIRTLTYIIKILKPKQYMGIK